MFGRNKHDKDKDRADALAAKAEAERELRDVKSRWPAVRAEGAWHRWRRDENHFATDLRTLMGGGHG